MSPLPMMGMCMRGSLFTCRMRDQSACPVYICARVRPWMVNARIPQSCRRGARSVMMRLLSLHPSRVFAVTGVCTALTTASVISSMRGIFCNIPAPAPFPATFFTGHPKLRSITSGCASLSTMRAACTTSSVVRPYICMPTGLSSSSMRSFLVAARTLRTSASAATNSLYIIAAPKRLHCLRKPMSVTSSMGASKSGREPRSMLSIFIIGAVAYDAVGGVARCVVLYALGVFFLFHGYILLDDEVVDDEVLALHGVLSHVICEEFLHLVALM